MADELTTPDWPAQFAAERPRVLAALGSILADGVVETLEHIGATSVPGVPAQPCVDLGASVYPFPLDAGRQQALAALGYQPVAGADGAPDQRFRHLSGGFELHVFEAGESPGLNALVLRDYLRADADARAAYSRAKAQIVAVGDKQALGVATLPAAERWWAAFHGFGPVRSVVTELDALPVPWLISSGWAIDLYLGSVSRVHRDIDVVIPRADQLTVQAHLAERGWTLRAPYAGLLEPWAPYMRLELPRHQALALREGGFIDILMSEIEGGVWRYRRDPTIVRDSALISLRSADGIPFLAPELVLLFKSRNTSDKAHRPQDQLDYERVRAALDSERRAWLRWALTRTSPEHPWIAELA